MRDTWCVEGVDPQLSTINPQPLGQAGDVEAGGGFAHLGGGDFLGLREGLVGRGQNHVLEQLGVAGIERLGVDLDCVDRTVARGDNLHSAAAAGCFDGAGSERGLDLFHLLLHARSLFHEFADAGHVVG